MPGNVGVAGSWFEKQCVSKHSHTGLSLERIRIRKRNVLDWTLLPRFYCQDVRAYDILFGDMPRPAQAEDLYEILDAFTEKYQSEAQRINARRAARERRKASVLLVSSLCSHRTPPCTEHSVLKSASL